jgi:hypothetical protein
MVALTDKEKDFLFKAMLADIGVTHTQNWRNSYYFSKKFGGFFGYEKVIGRCDPDFINYEMYGFPSTNSKIIDMIRERYNVDPKIIFDSDHPRDERISEL